MWRNYLGKRHSRQGAQHAGSLERFRWCHLQRTTRNVVDQEHMVWRERRRLQRHRQGLQKDLFLKSGWRNLCFTLMMKGSHWRMFGFWVRRPGALWGDPDSLTAMWEWGRGVESAAVGKDLVCVLFLIYGRELYFPHILLKRRLLPLPPLSSFALHLHIFLCFKRILWWQDYVKATGFWGALLANMSSSGQQHGYLPLSPTGSGRSVSHWRILSKQDQNPISIFKRPLWQQYGKQIGRGQKQRQEE